MHAVAVPGGAQQPPDPKGAAADSVAAKQHLDAQRESLVKRELSAYTAAVDAATGVRHGPFTIAELLELKKFTG